MRDKTRGEIDELARKGDKAARTARKLLTEKAVKQITLYLAWNTLSWYPDTTNPEATCGTAQPAYIVARLAERLAADRFAKSGWFSLTPTMKSKL
jgi:hypothetical protein